MSSSWSRAAKVYTMKTVCISWFEAWPYMNMKIHTYSSLLTLPTTGYYTIILWAWTHAATMSCNSNMLCTYQFYAPWFNNTNLNYIWTLEYDSKRIIIISMNLMCQTWAKCICTLTQLTDSMWDWVHACRNMYQNVVIII